MIQALTHSDRDICPDERIVQLSHVIQSPWSAVRQMALQSSRARWRKPLNLAALPSHAESPSVLLPRHQSSVSQVSVSQVPAQASFTLRLLLSTSLLLRTAGTHAQNRQGSQGDQLRHLHLRATCTCAPSACSSSSRKGSASRSRSSCGGSACSRTRERAARRRPVDLGMPFLQGFVFHMVPVRVKSNYYSFYRLGSASETVRRCATAAPPPSLSLFLFLLYAGLAERFLAVLALDTLKCAAMSIRSHVHDLRPLFTPSSSSAPYSYRRTAGCVLFVTCYLLPLKIPTSLYLPPKMSPNFLPIVFEMSPN